jgi:adenylate cyclase
MPVSAGDTGRSCRKSGLRRRNGWRPGRLFVRNWRLRPSILTLFVLLTAPVFLTIVATNYLSNESVARAHADSLVERFRTDAVDGIRNLFDPIKSLIRSAAALGDQRPDFYADNRSLKYLFSILLHSDKVVSVYAGLADGSFRQARRINPAAAIQDRLPPKGVAYAYRWTDSPATAQPLDHYLFLDAHEREIGRSQQPTTYDPRVRLWYRAAAESGSLIVTDPEVFAALGLIGFTVAAPFYADGKLAGVAAADITLDGLSAYLAERKISPGTLSYILDRKGRVIANSELAKTYSIKGGKVELQSITALAHPLLTKAFTLRPHRSDNLFTFVAAGHRYVASLSALTPYFGKRWQLFIITPLHDFTSSFERHNERLLLFGLTAIALQIAIIYFLSAVISSPLEQLARKVAEIRDLGGRRLPPLASPIREISVLSKAVDTLDAAIESFAAFVPVDLVRQLLESEQKLELGGHSRFLTIFFSDLEAFSTLSEETPSRDLLRQVSAYLEVVTKAVTQEAGTIDKFIGDGVMAFWGAPALLDDHAWRACVAALRIQQGMKILNDRWRKEEKKPLNIRIGIHSDAVLVGNIGCKERMGYTVIGDGVNVASRLEGINKEYGTRICISHNVFKEAGERLCLRPIDDVVVKGRRATIPIYELRGAIGIGPQFEPDAATLRLCKLTRLAYEALIREDLPLAFERYQAVLAEFPEDPVALALANRLAAMNAAFGGHNQTSAPRLERPRVEA